MFAMLKSITGSLALLCCVGLTSSALAETPELASHSARYRLSLLEAKIGEVSMLDGVMSFHVIRGCDAWTLQSSLDMAAGQPDGQNFQMAVEHQSREALDGSWLEFDTSFNANGGVQERYAGRAERAADGGVTAQFDYPEKASITLPAEVVFPIQAVEQTVAAFWDGKKRLVNYLYFDGSELDMAKATDLLAGTPDPLMDGAEDPDHLTQGDSRRIVTTLFDSSQTDSEPRSTYISDTLPNGVITRLTIDMGFMVVEARLVEVVAIAKPKC